MFSHKLLWYPLITLAFAASLFFLQFYLFLSDGPKDMYVNDACNVYVSEDTHVIDGDTLCANVDGTEERIRLIGIDTPEIDTAEGEDAKVYVENLLEGHELIYLVVETKNQRDVYDRILAYVWLTEPPAEIETQREQIHTSLNGLLVAQGFAKPMTIEPNTTFAQEFEELCK